MLPSILLRSRRALFIVIGVALFGTACSSLPGRPQAMTLLTLEPPALAPAGLPRRDAVLLFDRVDAAPALRDTLILYRRQGPTVHWYARHRWLALPAELVDQAFMESLAMQLPYAGVVRPGQGLAADRVLSLTLLRLEQEFAADGQSQVRLELLAQLLDRGHDRVIGLRHFHYREAAPQASAVGGAVAAGTALGRFFTDLRAWLSEVDR